ncbi:MAG TPA: hypothetical protein DDX98_15510 [Bacteroidales bacterium]|jgi:long-subunit fatty acid transport protein|nr:hypothetical protein [Bacteroidales bacterium]
MYCRIIILLLVTSFSIFSRAQDKDFRTWWGVQIEGELFDAIDYKVNPEVRYYQNSTKLITVLSDFDVSYPFLKYFRVGGQYRIEKLQVREEYAINRFGIYLKTRYKIKRFRLQYRAMYHWEYRGINTREAGNIPDEYHRHRFMLKYYRKKWDLRPEIAIEYFVNPQQSASIYEQKLRLSAGLEYRFNKHFSLSVAYKYQEEYFVESPLNAYILATKLTYRL